MRHASRYCNSELDKDERKLRAALEGIHKKLKSALALKQKVNDSLAAIQSLIDKHKLSIGCKLSGPLRNKVIKLYTNAKTACETEAAFVRRLLESIDNVRKMKYEIQRGGAMGRGELMQLLNHSAKTLPLWIGPPDTHPPPLVGAVPLSVNVTLKVGTEVAAYVDDMWILAEVVSVFRAGKYEVKDVDEEQKAKYTVRRSRLIPLPRWRADPLRDSHALFPVNALVLALYPQTTCFYKGAIEHVPESVSDDYLVAFEDSSFPQGYSPPLPVQQRYVLTYKVPRTYKRRVKSGAAGS